MVVESKENPIMHFGGGQAKKEEEKGVKSVLLWLQSER